MTRQRPPRLWASKIAIGAAIAVLTSCHSDRSMRRLPSQIEHFPADLSHAELDVAGIYADGWMSSQAAVNLHQPGDPSVLTIRGTLPQIGDPAFQTNVALQIDQMEVAQRSIGVGKFQLSAPVKNEAGKRRIAVVFSRSQELPGPDRRIVGAQLRFLGFESAKSAGSEGAGDIVHGANLRLGAGWGALETFQGEHFRWVDNDAQISIHGPQTGDAELSLALEAGPGVGGKCQIDVLDPSGGRVSAAVVEGRATVKFLLPVQRGTAAEFRLHVDGGGRRISSDPRILNFRVFRAAVEMRISPRTPPQ